MAFPEIEAPIKKNVFLFYMRNYKHPLNKFKKQALLELNERKDHDMVIMVRNKNEQMEQCDNLDVMANLFGGNFIDNIVSGFENDEKSFLNVLALSSFNEEKVLVKDEY